MPRPCALWVLLGTLGCSASGARPSDAGSDADSLSATRDASTARSIPEGREPLDAREPSETGAQQRAAGTARPSDAASTTASGSTGRTPDGDLGGTMAATDAAVQSVEASVPKDASAVADARAASRDADRAADAGAGLVFPEPEVFTLPIGSLRYGVSGRDPQTGLCVSMIWYMRGGQTRYCEIHDALTPYVHVEQSPQSGCWGYAPNAELLDQRGCVDFADLSDPDDDRVAIEVDIRSDLFTGTVRFGDSL